MLVVGLVVAMVWINGLGRELPIAARFYTSGMLALV